MVSQAWEGPVGYRTHVGRGMGGPEWRMKLNRRGGPVWWHRWLEAWWIVTGKWSLHRAWQAGKDKGHTDEIQRTLRGGR
jgi:hypothetical protein